MCRTLDTPLLGIRLYFGAKKNIGRKSILNNGEIEVRLENTWCNKFGDTIHLSILKNFFGMYNFNINPGAWNRLLIP